MESYKVWSMSGNPSETQFNLEHETRVIAYDRHEAIEKAMVDVKRREPDQVVENWDWRATKLP